jgi:hypothetical protein
VPTKRRCCTYHKIDERNIRIHGENLPILVYKLMIKECGKYDALDSTLSGGFAGSSPLVAVEVVGGLARWSVVV